MIELNPWRALKHPRTISRRALLRDAACGFGMLGLGGLLAEYARAAAQNPMAMRPAHFTPKAKRVIFLFMHGGPSSIDTFDPKPRLTRTTASRCPSSARWRSTMPLPGR